MVRRTLAASLLALAALVATPAAAQQSAAEDRYIAARDAAIKRFDNVQTDEKIMAEASAAEAALLKQMQALLGPIDIKGYARSSLNLGSIFTGDQGFGTLDGISYTTEDYKDGLIVTTRSLLLRWLRAHKNWWGDESMPAEPREAFGTENFYTQAVQTDAAILRFAEIPLGESGTNFAMLGTRTQSEVPNGADEVFVAAVKGDRAFIAYQKFAPPIEVASCRTERAKALQELDALAQNPRPEGEAGEVFQKKLNDMSGKTEEDLKRCFSVRGPKEPRFAEAVKLAKQLYQRLPAK
jgi:hypothetical protein